MTLQKRQIRVLYAIYLVIMVISALSGPMGHPDTQSYYTAWDTLCGMKLDIFRTPLYPVLVGIAGNIFGQVNSYIVVMLLQFVLFGISIRYFYLTVLSLTRPGRIPFYVTILYFISPSTLSWCNIIITESISISLMTMWTYAIVMLWVKGYSNKYAAWSCVLLLLLFMIRPSFAFLSPIIILYCLFYATKSIRQAIKILAYSIIPVITLIIYCAGFKSEYGVFTPSCVAQINQINMIKYDPGNGFDAIGDQQFREDLDTTKTESIVEFMPMVDKYGLVAIDRAIKTQISSNPKRFFLNNYEHAYKLFKDSEIFEYIHRTPLNSLLVLIAGLNGYNIIIITIAFFIYLVLMTIKGARPYLSAILLLIILANIMTALNGSYADHIRLIITSAPVMFIAIGIMLNSLRLNTSARLQ